MSARFGTALLVLFLALTGTAAHAADLAKLGQFIPVAPPQPAPAVSFATDAGKPVTLADFKGTPTVVNLWATWCGPCRHEMPSLDRLQADFAGKLAVLAVAEDRGGATAVDPFVKKAGLHGLRIYLDPTQKVAQAFAAGGLPTSIVLDAEGRVVGRVLGAADWTSPKMLAALRPLIGSDRPPITRAAR